MRDERARARVLWECMRVVSRIVSSHRGPLFFRSRVRCCLFSLCCSHPRSLGSPQSQLVVVVAEHPWGVGGGGGRDVRFGFSFSGVEA